MAKKFEERVDAIDQEIEGIKEGMKKLPEIENALVKLSEKMNAQVE